MATLPSQRTWANGDEPTAAMLNDDIRDAYTFLMNPPRALVYNSAGLSLTSAVWTLLTWNSEWYDSDGIHSTTTNTSRLTCVTSGVYEVTVHIEWQVGNDPSPGNRAVSVMLNNSGGIVPNGSAEVATDNQICEINDSSGKPQTNHLVFLIALTAGQYLEVIAMQTYNGARSTVESTGNRTTFGMIWLGAT